MRAFLLAVGTCVAQAKDVRSEQSDADAIVDAFKQVDANGPLALQGSVEGDPFKKTGRELRRIKEDDSGERLGFLSKVEGAEGSRTLNSSDLFSIPRQLGGRYTESSQPPEGTQQQEPAAIPSSIPRVFVPEEQTVVPEGDNFAGGSRLLNDSDLGVSIPRQFGPQRSYTQQQEPAAIPSDIPHVFAAEEKTEVPEKDNCAIPRNIPHGSVREEKPEVPEEDKCIICLEPKNEESIAPFKCATVKHSFCKGCVKRWIPINPTCPSCRTGLRSDSPLNALRTTEPLGTFRLRRQNALLDADLRPLLDLGTFRLRRQNALLDADLRPLLGLGTFRLRRQNVLLDADLRPLLLDDDLLDQSNSGEIP